MTGDVTYKTIRFPDQYFLLRQKEGRIYTDEEVLKLPEVNTQNPYYHEWQIRKNSCNQLVKYLSGKKKSLQILEVGCGNGWLSAKLSASPSCKVTGIDINNEELSQAKRVFYQVDNIEFSYSSLQDETFKNKQFDIIIFAASIQYFESLKNVLGDALSHLKPQGEIHIIDSHFYKQSEIGAAHERSMDYYRAIGFPEMVNHYFHHSLDEIKLFNYKILHNPDSIINRVKKNKNPFYWVCVKADA